MQNEGPVFVVSAVAGAGACAGGGAEAGGEAEAGGGAEAGTGAGGAGAGMRGESIEASALPSPKGALMTFPLPRAAEMSSGDEQIWMREVGKKGSSSFHR